MQITLLGYGIFHKTVDIFVQCCGELSVDKGYGLVWFIFIATLENLGQTLSVTN
jgi:hypothetical protein